MKIEKGKLYYNGECVKKAMDDMYFDRNDNVTDKIAVHCRTKDDSDYVYRVIDLNITERDNVLIFLDNLTWGYDDSAIFHRNYGYHIISIDEFKRFYPEEPKDISLPIVDNTNVDNIIEVLKIQTQLEYSIEAIERELSRLKELKQNIKNILK